MVDQIAVISVQEIRSNYQGSEAKVKRDLPNQPNYWHMLHLVTIIGITTLFLAPQTLIPRHNSIYYPNYWYEINVVIVPVGSIILVLRTMLEWFTFTKEKSILTTTVGLKVFASIYLPTISLAVFSRVYWTTLMGFPHPMPLHGIFVFFLGWFLCICAYRSGIVFPSDLRMNDGFKNKIKTYVMFDAWWLVMNFQKDVLSIGFKSITGYPQCLFAVLIPFAKDMNKRILKKMVAKMVGNDDEMENVLLAVRLNIHYALFVAIRMNGAEDLTILSVLFVDFLLQSKMTIQIIKLNRQVLNNGEDRETISKRKEKEVLKLLMAELTEGLVPICYAIAFAMAYYGPNATLKGNVQSDIWQYEIVEDVARLFFIQGLLFGIDLFCVILNTLYVSKFGRVDLIMQFSKLLENYWIVVVIQMMDGIVFYFGLNDINMGLDMTLKFDWITADGRAKFIYNATDLTDENKAMLLSNISFS